MQAAVTIRIDRSKRLHEQAHLGHNRWHPDIPPVARANPGDVVAIETVDCDDGEITADWKSSQVGTCSPGIVHPLTGPVHVVGTEPGDILEVHILDILPQPRGHTMHGPAF